MLKDEISQTIFTNLALKKGFNYIVTSYFNLFHIGALTQTECEQVHNIKHQLFQCHPHEQIPIFRFFDAFRFGCTPQSYVEVKHRKRLKSISMRKAKWNIEVHKIIDCTLLYKESDECNLDLLYVAYFWNIFPDTPDVQWKTDHFHQ